jgi:hypothetical protein
LPTSVLSDCHIVTAVNVPLCRDAVENADEAILHPTTVTVVEPVTAALEMMTVLRPGASIVNDAVKLFTCQPVVITTHRCGQMPIAALLTTQLSERQMVASMVVELTRAPLLKSLDPALLPTTVTLIAPDEATLDIITLHGAVASIVNDAVKLFLCQPVVVITRRSVQMPIACFVIMELSERQCVACDIVLPMRDRVLNDATFVATIVTLTAPDEAALDMMALLGAGASIVIDAVKLFACHPVVNTTRRSVHSPELDRPNMALSDIQLVISDTDPPVRTPLE